MPMLDKPIADITADDIQHFVDEGTPEKRMSLIRFGGRFSYAA